MGLSAVCRRRQSQASRPVSRAASTSHSAMSRMNALPVWATKTLRSRMVRLITAQRLRTRRTRSVGVRSTFKIARLATDVRSGACTISLIICFTNRRRLVASGIAAASALSSSRRASEARCSSSSRASMAAVWRAIGSVASLLFIPLASPVSIGSASRTGSAEPPQSERPPVVSTRREVSCG